MKVMVCEICRGHEFLKRDGEYVCTTCNTRYTVEEARSLLVDNGYGHKDDGRVKDYLDLAIQSRNAGAHFESEVYCDKALGLDAGNYQALCLKAEVVALQTTDLDDRTLEAIAQFEKALAAAQEEFKESLRVTAAQTISKAIETRVLLLGNRYATIADEGTGGEMLTLPLYVEDRDARFREAVGANVLNDGMRTSVANVMDASATLAWNRVILPAYANDEHRGKSATDAFVDGGDMVIAIMESSLGFDPCDVGGKKRRLLGLIAVQEVVLDAHSMRLDGGRWVRAYSLSEENKARRRDDILAWKREVRQIDPDYEFATCPQSVVSQSTSGKEGKPKGVMSRTVTRQMSVVMMCIVRSLSLGTSPQGISIEALLWLGVGAAFVVWWYQVSG